MKDRDFDIYLYYPATSEGQGAPIISGGPFPVVSFAHGLFQPLFEYTSYFEHLSSWGFIVIGPNSDYTPATKYYMEQYATDMRLCLDYLEAANADATSFLYGKIDVSNMGVTGHSEGAYLSLYSTAWPQVDPRVKAVAPIAGGMLDSKLMANILCPALIIGGSDDFLAPPSSSVGIYSSLPSTPRLLNIIEGGWHCGFMDESIELPDFLCRSLTGWIDRDLQMELTHCLINSFFLAHLKQDNDAANVVYQAGSILSNVISTIDAGFTLDELNPQLPNCSAVNVFYVNLTNNELQPTSFNVYVASGSENASVSPTQTRVLAPGQSTQIMVKLGSSAKKRRLQSNSVTIGAMSSTNTIPRTFYTVSCL
jgi:dienelactone hydrolase